MRSLGPGEKAVNLIVKDGPRYRVSQGHTYTPKGLAGYLNTWQVNNGLAAIFSHEFFDTAVAYGDTLESALDGFRGVAEVMPDSVIWDGRTWTHREEMV